MFNDMQSSVDSWGLTSAVDLCRVQLIVLSFTLIISLMIGTFAVVVKLGGVRFNE